MRRTFVFAALVGSALGAALAYAQRVDTYELANVTWQSTQFLPTADGGVAVVGCASVSTADGGSTFASCSAPFSAPTATKRTSWQTAADIGLRAWLREERLNASAVP